MITAAREVFAGRFDPLLFRDCTAQNLVGRLQMASTFVSRHGNDLVSASGLIETLADVRHLYPETAELVSELFTELSATTRYGDFFKGEVVRPMCQRLLDVIDVTVDAAAAVMVSA